MFLKTKKNHHPRTLQKGKDGKIHGELSHEASISGELPMMTSMAAMATVAEGSHGALTEKCPGSNGLARHPGPRSSRQGWKASRCKASWTLRGLPPPMHILIGFDRCQDMSIWYLAVMLDVRY